MEKNSKIFVIISYLYIVIPILIFVIGWCNPLVSILGLLIILPSLYFCIKNSKSLWLPTSKKGWIFLLSLFIIALIWVFSSGIGGYVFQNPDHHCRNAIFDLLSLKDWPVVVKPSGQNLLLTYYIAFWLPSALISKTTGSLSVGYFVQLLWASLGVFLTFYYSLSFIKKKNIFPILLFIFFSGLDLIYAYFFDKPLLLVGISHLEWYFDSYQISSMTTQLYWVFNQAIPAWVITLTILKEKNNKNILFLYACSFLACTLPSIGMFPIVLYCLYKNGLDNSVLVKETILQRLKNSITFQNTIGFLFVFLVSAVYLTGNIAGTERSVVSGNAFSFFNYLVFILLDVGIYMLLIWKNFKNNPLYYITLACFLIYPLIYIGGSIDFCMRATIPPLIILYLYIIKIFDNGFLKQKLVCSLLAIALLLGACTPIHEMNRTIVYTLLGKTKIVSYIGLGNFFAYADKSVFLKYFGKPVKK